MGHDPDGEAVAPGVIAGEGAPEPGVVVVEGPDERHRHHRPVGQLVTLAHWPVQELHVDVVG